MNQSKFYTCTQPVGNHLVEKEIKSGRKGNRCRVRSVVGSSGERACILTKIPWQRVERNVVPIMGESEGFFERFSELKRSTLDVRESGAIN